LNPAAPALISAAGTSRTVEARFGGRAICEVACSDYLKLAAQQFIAD